MVTPFTFSETMFKPCCEAKTCVQVPTQVRYVKYVQFSQISITKDKNTHFHHIQGYTENRFVHSVIFGFRYKEDRKLMAGLEPTVVTKGKVSAMLRCLRVKVLHLHTKNSCERLTLRKQISSKRPVYC